MLVTRLDCLLRTEAIKEKTKQDSLRLTHTSELKYLTQRRKIEGEEEERRKTGWYAALMPVQYMKAQREAD